VCPPALTRRPTTPAAPSAVAAELAGLRRLVANQANNINQIARKLNSGGRPDGSIAPAADAVRRTMRRLEAVLDTAARTGLLQVQDQAIQHPEPDQSGSPRIIPPPPRNTPWTPA
jgi:hypothetical protein